MAKPKVFIVDDHPVIVEGLVQLISQTDEYEIAGTAGSFEDAMAQMEANATDFAVVDIGLPGKNGIDLIYELKYRLPKIKIIVFSMYDELSLAPKALRAGARGYVMKSSPPTQILTALEVVGSGKNFVSDVVKDLIFNHFVLNNADADSLLDNSVLTMQEQSIFRLIGMGYSSSQIAEKLCISAKTVQSHKDNIKRKLKISTSCELYRRAFSWIGDAPTLSP